MLPSSVAERLDRLAPDQRAAATAPPGPVLCVAPAGSGKTTTLVARIAWLVATGADPAAITAVTFNKRAADEMAARVDSALEPLGLTAGSVRVKTFHALGREILADGGESVEPLLDREAVLRDMWPDITAGAIRRLDDAFSRLKLEIGVTAREVATTRNPAPSPEHSSPMSRPWRTPADSTSTTWWLGRFGCSRLGRPFSGAGAPSATTSWSMRCRMSTGLNSGWPCCWPHPQTEYSELAMTTRRSTAGVAEGRTPRDYGCVVLAVRDRTEPMHPAWARCLAQPPRLLASATSVACGPGQGHATALTWPGQPSGTCGVRDQCGLSRTRLIRNSNWSLLYTECTASTGVPSARLAMRIRTMTG